MCFILRITHFVAFYIRARKTLSQSDPTYIWHSWELCIQSAESLPSSSRVEHLALGDWDIELHERNEPSTKPNCLRIPGVWDLGCSEVQLFRCSDVQMCQPARQRWYNDDDHDHDHRSTAHAMLYGLHKCEREPPTYWMGVCACVCV